MGLSQVAKAKFKIWPEPSLPSPAHFWKDEGKAKGRQMEWLFALGLH